MAVSVVGKGPAGVERFVNEVVVGAAVKLIRSRFHRDVKQAAARLTEFRRVVAGLDGDLLCRLHAGLRLGDTAEANRGCGILTLDAKRGRVALQSIDADSLIRQPCGARNDIHNRVGAANP